MAVKIPQTLISELLTLRKIPRDDIAAAVLSAQKEDKDFGQILVDKGLISDEDLLLLKADVYKLPRVSFQEIDVDKKALKEVSEDVVSFYRIIPFEKNEKTGLLKVGILNPEDIDALEALKFIATGKKYTLEKYLISYKDFENTLRKYRTLTGEVGKALKTLSEEVQAAGGEEDIELEEITSESPVTKIVAAMLKHATQSRASDIHIEPFENRVRTRFRIDGILVSTLDLPKKLHAPVVTRVKILADLKIDESRVPQDGRFSIIMNKNKIDFRVSTFPTKNGEKVVMRILDPLSSRIDLPGLGIQGRSLELLEKAMAKPFGSILITGPTGSGKSTTIAGMLKVLNSEEVNIVTLENPIEYFIDGVNQSQTHEEIGYTFANGLRSILRQDPDIIMVGEIRDGETAGLATQAALTGHVVLSTLHTNDSLGVIPRLVDMGVEKYLIPPTVNLAVAQRLLRKLCTTCKVKSQASNSENRIIEEALKRMPKEYQDKHMSKSGYTIYKPPEQSSCKACQGKAFKGRLGIFEMMEMTEELEKIILTSLSESAMREEARRQGMVTMYQDGMLKVLDGVVSIEELLEAAQDQEQQAKREEA